MKNILLVLLLMLFPVIGQAHDNVRIAVVDIQRVESESMAWQKTVQQIQDSFAQKRANILAQDQALQQEMSQYQQQRPLLSAEQQQQRDQELNEKIAALQNLAAEQNGLFDEQTVRANQALRVQIAREIEVIAKERDLDLIMEVSANNFDVVFYTARLEISDTVIERLNVNYPDIVLE